MLGALRAQLLGPLILALSSTSLSALAQDDVSPSQGASAAQSAAAQFDAGVQAYKQADYARAAEAFLNADGLVPSASVLANALMAARRAGLPLLIARAAERALARADTSESERRSAENALAEQIPKLSRLELSCEGACQAQVDGSSLASQGSYVLPGEHRLSARGFVEETVRCEAAVPCHVVLRPLPTEPAVSETAPQAPKAAPAAALEPPPAAPPGQEAHARRKKNRLALGVFASSGAGALLLLSLATWQGVAALDAKRDYEDGGTVTWDRVTTLANRSDYLLAGGVVLAGTAIASAIWWVDWGAYGETRLSLSGQGGATLSLRRRF